MSKSRARSGGAVIGELARERLGFERLRPGQLRATEALVGGRDVLAGLPTGGGKSAIYELAGMLRTGPAVVVSPLIALQDDQLAHPQAAGLPAIVLNSQQSAGARAAALLASCDPDTFVFLSPEQLANPETRQALRRARPGLFVDEAHLISQWGHDFRPDYMVLGAQAEAVGAPVRLALTATAAPPVRQEIVRRLGLRDPQVVNGPSMSLGQHRWSIDAVWPGPSGAARQPCELVAPHRRFLHVRRPRPPAWAKRCTPVPRRIRPCILSLVRTRERGRG